MLGTFPQLSQTYVKWEIEALAIDFDIHVITLREAQVPYERHHPYELATSEEEVYEILEDLAPDVLHTHYLTYAEMVHRCASHIGVPFSIRSHSFDILQNDPGSALSEDSQERRKARLAAVARLVDDESCLGVLIFPFVRQLLEAAAFPADKLHDCYPVVNTGLFLDASENGAGVMNTGACLPKKKMDDFLILGASLPEKRFTLYPVGYLAPELEEANAKLGTPVKFSAPVQPEDMPSEYKKHEWLVYTASRDLGTVGWPMAIAEAQASGVGVCMPALRDDLHEYVGGAGFLYQSLDEVREIVSRPYPPEMRETGFEQAKRSDIWAHKEKLSQLWGKVTPSRIRSTPGPSTNK